MVFRRREDLQEELPPAVPKVTKPIVPAPPTELYQTGTTPTYRQTSTFVPGLDQEASQGLLRTTNRQARLRDALRTSQQTRSERTSSFSTTPTEQRAATQSTTFGRNVPINPTHPGAPGDYYVPYQRNISGNQQTFYTGGVGSADQEAAFNQFMMAYEAKDPNLLPGYITPLTQQIFGINNVDMEEFGYLQDPMGGWVHFPRDADTIPSTTSGGYDTDGGGGRSNRGRRGNYRTPQSFRSGYGFGLINWRIGL